MSARRVGTVVTVALGLLLSLGAAPVTAGAELPSPSPALAVSVRSASAGDRVEVLGTGWPASQVVDLSICGNGGDGGSASCNRAGSVTVGVGENGQFGAALMASIPPVACPCVVRGVSGQWTAVQPVEIVGAPVRTTTEVAAVPEATSIAVTGSGPWTAWFGGAPQRTVDVTVSNPSDGVVRDPRVEVRWGDEGAEQSTLVRVGQDVAPRSQVVVSTSVALPAMTWGEVPVRARVVTTGTSTWVDATASSHPWGLLVVAFVLLQVLVVVILLRNRRVRRARVAARQAAAPVPVEAATSVAPPGPELVVAGPAAVAARVEPGAAGDEDAIGLGEEPVAPVPPVVVPVAAVIDLREEPVVVPEDEVIDLPEEPVVIPADEVIDLRDEPVVVPDDEVLHVPEDAVVVPGDDVLDLREEAVAAAPLAWSVGDDLLRGSPPADHAVGASEAPSPAPGTVSTLERDTPERLGAAPPSCEAGPITLWKAPRVPQTRWRAR